MATFQSKGGKTHERMGDKLSSQIFEAILTDISKLSGRPSRLLVIEYYIIYQLTLDILADKGEAAILHSIVDATIDADRLDFVQRDSNSAGLGETVRYARITEGMRLCKTSEGAFVFAFPRKAITSLETFLRQRYRSYDTVVWHHRVVKSEALLKKAVIELGLKQLGLNEMPVQPADNETPKTSAMEENARRLPADVSGLWVPFQLTDRNSQIANKHVFGQWNDAWLVTTLTGEYIDLCLQKENEDEACDELMHGRLAELLYSEHHYVSLIKRFGDIAPATRLFDEALEKSLKTRGLTVRNVIERLRGCLTHHGELQSDDAKMELDADPTARAFLALLPQDKATVDARRNPIVLSRKLYDALSVNKANDHKGAPRSYAQLVDQIIRTFIGQLKTQGICVGGETRRVEVLEYLSVMRKLSHGISARVDTFLYDDAHAATGTAATLINFEDDSTVKDSIILDEQTRPPFYVYVRLGRQDSDVAQVEQAVRVEFVRYVSQYLSGWYTDEYESFVTWLETTQSHQS